MYLLRPVFMLCRMQENALKLKNAPYTYCLHCLFAGFLGEHGRTCCSGKEAGTDQEIEI